MQSVGFHLGEADASRLIQTDPLSRPHSLVQVGSLVYCRVAIANKDMDPELSCMGESATVPRGVEPNGSCISGRLA